MFAARCEYLWVLSHAYTEQTRVTPQTSPALAEMECSALERVRIMQYGVPGAAIHVQANTHAEKGRERSRQNLAFDTESSAIIV